MPAAAEKVSSLPEFLREGLERTFTLNRDTIDQEQRTVEIAFATETPVERWWGMEVLDMGSKSVRLKRIKRGGALLMDHNVTDQVGVVDSVRIDSDKVARAIVRFGKSARASEILQDVVDGIRTNISVGYQIYSAVLESTDDGADTYRITDWEPYEISFVSVPADINSGVGRANAKTAKETAAMPEAIETTREVPVDQAAIRAAGADAERKRTQDIFAIADQYDKEKRHKLHDLAGEAVRGGVTLEDFKTKVMERMSSAPKPTAEIGLTEREVRRYSFVRMMNALANPQDQAAQRSAAFEFECSTAARERSQKTGKPGMTIPFDVLNRGHALMQQQRDITAGGSGNGANVVATDLLAGDFITLLRNRMVINRLGTTTLTGLQGNIAIPRQTGAATSYWVAENNAPTESDQTLDQVAMSPKTIAAWTDISRRLLIQSSIDVENMVQVDLATVLALSIQSVAIKGGGSNQPSGILANGSIGSVAGGTNGAQPTFAEMVALETAISSANADVGTLWYLTNAKVRGFLKTQPKIGSTFPVFTWENGDTPLNGYGAAVTNAVPSNLTKGTASAICSAIIFGNFADLIVGLWGGLDLMVDPYSKSTTGAVRVVVMQDCDVAVRHPESFAAMQDALTS